MRTGWCSIKKTKEGRERERRWGKDRNASSVHCMHFCTSPHNTAQAFLFLCFEPWWEVCGVKDEQSWKLYNEHFHRNQIAAVSPINKKWPTYCAGLLVQFTFKFLHEHCTSLLTNNPPWKWALIHKTEGWYALTNPCKVFLLCSGEHGHCSRKDGKTQRRNASNYNLINIPMQK